MFSQAVVAGDLRMVEETEASLGFGLRARLAGVGFMPGQGWLGTDLLKARPDVKVFTLRVRFGFRVSRALAVSSPAHTLPPETVKKPPHAADTVEEIYR